MHDVIAPGQRAAVEKQVVHALAAAGAGATGMCAVWQTDSGDWRTVLDGEFTVDQLRTVVDILSDTQAGV